MKDHGAEATGHVVQALGHVAVVGELGVVKAAAQHALVAVRDELRGRRVGVVDVEERRQQLAVAVAHRQVALVALHGRDEHGVGQAQVTFVDAPALHTRPLDQEEVLGEHVAGVGPLAAQLLGARVQTLGDEAPALVLRDHDLVLDQVPLVVLGLADDDRRSQHAVALAHIPERQAVERAVDGARPQLDHEPADGPRETEVVLLPLRTAAPAHAARDLQPGDELAHQLRKHVRGERPRRLDADHGELGAVLHLAAHVLRLRALGAREAGAGLGQPAGLVEGDLGLGPAEVVGAGRLAVRHVLRQHGDTPR